jgi:hypothetical protein
MKKVFLFCVLALAFASCSPKKAEEAPKADSTVVAVDTVATDSAVVTTSTDTTAVVK